MNCYRNCGVEIHFDDNVLSKSGKKIPLEGDNKPHRCPNSTYKPKKETNVMGYSFSDFKIVDGFYIHINDLPLTEIPPWASN